MMNSDKYQHGQQMHLPCAEGCGFDNQAVTGMDVYFTGSGRVREEWVSMCKKERALTTQCCSKLMKPPST